MKINFTALKSAFEIFSKKHKPKIASLSQQSDKKRQLTF